jgi:hypothetical protein
MSKPHEDRVIEEAEQLENKLKLLRQFTASLTFVAIQVDEQVRLLRQAQYMTQYLGVLKERIEAFPKD